MKPSLKLDEDLSPLVGQPFETAGHSVLTVPEQGWSGFDDLDLLSGLKSEGRLLVTADKGFGDIHRYPPGSHPGILLLRPDRESILEYRALVEQIVAQYDLADLVGATTVVTPRRVRVRRAE